jgi:hypothetical protein
MMMVAIMGVAAGSGIPKGIPRLRAAAGKTPTMETAAGSGIPKVTPRLRAAAGRTPITETAAGMAIPKGIRKPRAAAGKNVRIEGAGVHPRGPAARAVIRMMTIAAIHPALPAVAEAEAKAKAKAKAGVVIRAAAAGSVIQKVTARQPVKDGKAVVMIVN